MDAAVAQNRCLMTCLLNVYVLKPASGVARRSLSRGTNHNNEPLRSHIEQLQAMRAFDRALDLEHHPPAMAATLVFQRSPSPCSVPAVSFAELDRETVRLAGQPLHARRIAVRGLQRLGGPVAAKLDARRRRQSR